MNAPGTTTRTVRLRSGGWVSLTIEGSGAITNVDDLQFVVEIEELFDAYEADAEPASAPKPGRRR